LQPLFKLQGIHTERLFTGQGIAVWTAFIPFTVDSEGRFYFEQYVGYTIWNIMHCPNYTFLTLQFNNAGFNPRPHRQASVGGFELENDYFDSS
jgi:hypothetical protein